MIPNQFEYKQIPSKDSLGGYYVLRTNTKTGTTERVALSHATDTDSIYILKTIDTDQKGKKYNRYWEFEPGWEHLDDFYYNGAADIFRGFNEPRFFEIIVSPGRVKSWNPLSTETYEHSLSLHVPANHREFDLPGVAGEESVTGEGEPVMFHPIDILNELYWMMTDFSERHSQFQDVLDGKTQQHGIQQGDPLRAYQAVSLAYPFFEGLVYQLTDRVLLKNESFKGSSELRFKQLNHNTPQTKPKPLINQLKTSHGVANSYERDFLIETFYDETIGLGIARNDLAHDLFYATRGFQQISWCELARRLIVSIAFLNEKVACIYAPVNSAHIRYFEWWLQEQVKAGVVNLHSTARH